MVMLNGLCSGKVQIHALWQLFTAKHDYLDEKTFIYIFEKPIRYSCFAGVPPWDKLYIYEMTMNSPNYKKTYHALDKQVHKLPIVL